MDTMRKIANNRLNVQMVHHEVTRSVKEDNSEKEIKWVDYKKANYTPGSSKNKTIWYKGGARKY